MRQLRLPVAYLMELAVWTEGPPYKSKATMASSRRTLALKEEENLISAYSLLEGHLSTSTCNSLLIEEL